MGKLEDRHEAQKKIIDMDNINEIRYHKNAARRSGDEDAEKQFNNFENEALQREHYSNSSSGSSTPVSPMQVLRTAWEGYKFVSIATLIIVPIVVFCLFGIPAISKSIETNKLNKEYPYVEYIPQLTGSRLDQVDWIVEAYNEKLVLGADNQWTVSFVIPGNTEEGTVRKGSYYVYDQEPRSSSTKQRTDRNIIAYIREGEDLATLIPELIGMTEIDALATLEECGIDVEINYWKTSSHHKETNIVYDQTPYLCDRDFLPGNKIILSIRGQED